MKFFGGVESVGLDAQVEEFKRVGLNPSTLSPFNQQKRLEMVKPKTFRP